MSCCPICDARIPAHKLMCWTHWGMVPANLQDQVLGLWKTTLRGRNASIRHLAGEEYRTAKEAAIAAVREKLNEGKVMT